MNDFQLSFEQRERYLYVKGVGVRKDLKAIFESTKALTAIVVETKAKYILLDYAELITVAGNHDAFNITRLYENKAAVLYELCVSIIINPRELDVEKYWEDICLRRGFDFKIFTDAAEAENWLIAKSESLHRSRASY
jgi:hypothetical protein